MILLEGAVTTNLVLDQITMNAHLNKTSSATEFIVIKNDLNAQVEAKNINFIASEGEDCTFLKIEYSTAELPLVDIENWTFEGGSYLSGFKAVDIVGSNTATSPKTISMTTIIANNSASFSAASMFNIQGKTATITASTFTLTGSSFASSSTFLNLDGVV